MNKTEEIAGKDNALLEKENFLFTDVDVDEDLKEELTDLNKNPLIADKNEVVDSSTFDILVDLIDRRKYDGDLFNSLQKKILSIQKKNGSKPNVFSNLIKNSDPALNFMDKINNQEKKENIQQLTEKNPDEKILIDNEPFLKNQIDLIASKVLSKCNYFSKKRKKNDTNLLKMNGKLMFTRGKPVREFVAEHNLNTIH